LIKERKKEKEKEKRKKRKKEKKRKKKKRNIDICIYMSKIDRPPSPIELAPGDHRTTTEHFYYLTTEQRDIALLEYAATHGHNIDIVDEDAYLSNYASSNNRFLSQDLIDFALSEYTATHGHSEFLYT
jgi:hypothetical protein